MKITPDEFVEDDEDTWLLEDFEVSPSRPRVSIVVCNKGEPPSAAQARKIDKLLARLDALILQAAPFILENYSRDHFKGLGIAEEKLVEETHEAIARAVTLESICVFDADENDFELSFSAPWDPHHSFDVEFEAGEATDCSVNG